MVVRLLGLQVRIQPDARTIDCCEFWLLSPLRRADHSSSVVLPNVYVECVSLNVIRHHNNPLHVK